MALVVIWALLAAGCQAPAATPTVAPASPAALPSTPPPAALASTPGSPPVVSVTPVVLATPTPPPRPTPTRGPTQPPEPSPTPYTVHVGNDSGTTVYLFNSPVTGDRIQAYPDGTPLLVISGDVEGDGLTWHFVRAPDGTEGYVPVGDTTAPDAELPSP